MTQGTASTAVTLVHDQEGSSGSAPVRHAIERLCAALANQSIAVDRQPTPPKPGGARPCIVVAARSSQATKTLLGASFDSEHLDTPQSLAIVPAKSDRRGALVITGGDGVGIAYGVLELVDRLRHGASLRDLLEARACIQRPQNRVRSAIRTFQSDVEDEPWLHDRPLWQRYLDMLIEQRFNRVQLCFGLGYDYPYIHIKGPRDAYLDFAYPFLVDVPRSGVRVPELPDQQRQRNLESLRWISEQAAVRGLEFQLGLWSHAYDWPHAPQANFTISGLTPANHAAWCRDALVELLAACPSISGVTFRAHYESGIPEGTHAFWRTVWDAFTRCGREVGIDIHAKGIDRELIDIACATGQRVTVSPKFWAEHMGLAWQPGSIRESERHTRAGENKLAQAARRFMRYSYGDVLREDRSYDVLFRIWPGTQRVLMWGDPELAAGYSRAAGFCGADGLELFEPLSFKGRMNSGLPGRRDGYADESLEQDELEKHELWYRLWGRLLFDPHEPSESWLRAISVDVGAAAAPQAQAALAHASRILPLVTTAHLPSAANKHFWPEMYVNMPIADGAIPHPYHDTPEPRDFCSVSPLDPAIFASINEFADGLVSGEPSAKVAPLEVADWLESLAEQAGTSLDAALRLARSARPPELARLAIDVSVQRDLGRFFAEKLRAGVGYALHVRTGGRDVLERAIRHYSAAREAWISIINRTRGVYVSDMTFGPEAHNRGHWADRLTAIEKDLAAMRQRLDSARESSAAEPDLMEWQRSPMPAIRHVPASSFAASQPLRIEIAGAPADLAIRLHYRHVNQSESYAPLDMHAEDDVASAAIPAEFTDAAYAVMYFFELRRGGDAWLSPGAAPPWTTPPYFVVRPEGATSRR